MVSDFGFVNDQTEQKNMIQQRIDILLRLLSLEGLKFDSIAKTFFVWFNQIRNIWKILPSKIWNNSLDNAIMVICEMTIMNKYYIFGPMTNYSLWTSHPNLARKYIGSCHNMVTDHDTKNFLYHLAVRSMEYQQEKWNYKNPFGNSLQALSPKDKTINNIVSVVKQHVEKNMGTMLHVLDPQKLHYTCLAQRNAKKSPHSHAHATNYI